MSDSEKLKCSWWDCMKTLEHKWHAPIVSIEWLCWRILPFLRQLSFLEVLEYLSRLAVLSAVIFYFLGCEDRQKAKHYQAWQAINTAQGKPGSGGRRDALQDLHNDGVSLAGIDISKAYLPRLKLENADLSEANLSNAILYEANFSGANFRLAILCDTDLHDADLSDANLTHANLYKAHLTEADLSDANLWYADIYDADLWYANLSGANLTSIKGWQGVNNIRNANINGVKNPPDKFIKWALENGAVCKKEEEWIEFLREKEQEKTQKK